jgi:two-component system, cell cycle response regulator DivK
MGPRQHIPADAAASTQNKAVKILLIEDNSQNRYLATFLLEQRGHQVIPAESGPEGIKLAHQVQPELILLDIQLPVMDGYAVARMLRQNWALRDVPIVAVTSYAMVGDRERAMAAGCSGYLEKPIVPETFVREVEGYAKAPPQSGGP